MTRTCWPGSSAMWLSSQVTLGKVSLPRDHSLCVDIPSNGHGPKQGGEIGVGPGFQVGIRFVYERREEPLMNFSLVLPSRDRLPLLKGRGEICLVAPGDRMPDARRCGVCGTQTSRSPPLQLTAARQPSRAEQSKEAVDLAGKGWYTVRNGGTSALRGDPMLLDARIVLNVARTIRSLIRSTID